MTSDPPAASPGLQELWNSLGAWACMAVLCGAIAVILWRAFPRKRVWPRQRQRLVTWTMLDFALIFLITQMALPALLGVLLYPWFQFPAQAQVTVADRIGRFASQAATGMPSAQWIAASRVDTLCYQAHYARLSMWVMAICAPFQILVILGVLRLRAEAPPLQMGLSLHRWPADLMAGFWTWLFVTPLCYTLFWVVQLPALSEVIGPVGQHLLSYLILLGPTSGEWVLLLLLTVLAAPVVEELLLRGVVQPLLVKHPLLADSFVITGLLVAILVGLSPAEKSGSPWLPLVLLPTIGLGYLAFEWVMQPWLPRPGAARAIYATSLLFAAMHIDAWPTPIPLFLLSLGLGFVAYRTQSIWSAVFMHALFNLVNFVSMALVSLRS